MRTGYNTKMNPEYLPLDTGNNHRKTISIVFAIPRDIPIISRIPRILFPIFSYQFNKIPIAIRHLISHAYSEEKNRPKT